MTKGKPEPTDATSKSDAVNDIFNDLVSNSGQDPEKGVSQTQTIQYLRSQGYDIRVIKKFLGLPDL